MCCGCVVKVRHSIHCCRCVGLVAMLGGYILLVVLANGKRKHKSVERIFGYCLHFTLIFCDLCIYATCSHRRGTLRIDLYVKVKNYLSKIPIYISSKRFRRQYLYIRDGATFLKP